jgi:hypothetical protein
MHARCTKRLMRGNSVQKCYTWPKRHLFCKVFPSSGRQLIHIRREYNQRPGRRGRRSRCTRSAGRRSGHGSGAQVAGGLHLLGSWRTGHVSAAEDAEVQVHCAACARRPRPHVLSPSLSLPAAGTPLLCPGAHHYGLSACGRHPTWRPPRQAAAADVTGACAPAFLLRPVALGRSTKTPRRMDHAFVRRLVRHTEKFLKPWGPLARLQVRWFFESPPADRRQSAL